MVRKILIGIAALVVVLVLVVATRPSTFHIERSITIAAPPERPFAHVNDFHRWGAWSPWEKVDPQMKRTFSGAPEGTGAVLRMGRQQRDRRGAHDDRAERHARRRSSSASSS